MVGFCHGGNMLGNHDDDGDDDDDGDSLPCSEKTQQIPGKNLPLWRQLIFPPLSATNSQRNK